MADLFPEDETADSTYNAGEDQDQPPSPDDMLISALAKWISKRGRNLPPPCFVNLAETARWWRSDMQEGERKGENRKVASRGGQVGWSMDYALRLRSSLLKFLDLTPEGRNFVVAAREDNVFWRGESMQAFAQIYEQTHLMRSTSAEEYRAKALRKMARLDFSMPQVQA